jgi:hypothetical protein
LLFICSKICKIQLHKINIRKASGDCQGLRGIT